MTKYLLAAAALVAISSPVRAEVKATSETGFSVVHIAEVEATPDALWKRLLVPKDWWSKAHSWSGSSDGFSINAKANGCFCELIQEKSADGKSTTVGSVEHMRVIFAHPNKVLRMQGALGPLQSEAVIGTLTIAMEPVRQGAAAKISFSYVVGGYMRYKIADIAPAVDTVLGEQFKNLIAPFASTGASNSKAQGFSLDVEKLAEPAAPKEILQAGPLAEDEEPR